ncbi:PP2C family serine/threonine-protein phosphatase [Agreia sp. COWG]|uniref:PP2C family protein-serine/threonine phosphatase n=1 Tax=Agreia sp. COWG TaxID=2773266 RepID=UPI001928D49B|nr:protein phosphatase 2C domain-containing protein [Agreia sp. COWG]CAD6011434.1 PPM-type phosphatase domain-containing protein [Agreia sp. COWG]
MTPPPPVGASSVVLHSGAATHRGLKRPANEDAYLAASPVFLVADGMGGHEAGERASAIVVESFDGLTGRPTVAPIDVRAAFDRAYRSISELSSGGKRRAGTTVSGVAVVESDGVALWLVFNLGDSRTYRLNGDSLEQISIDHSVVQELLDGGGIDIAAAAVHPARNVITRALGAGGDYRPDFWLVPIEEGDRMFICSDGVSGEVDTETIARILSVEKDPQMAADHLVREGMARGGHDNLTAVVVDARLSETEQDTAMPDDTIPRGNAPITGVAR